MQLILQRKHGERRRCESCGALPAWLALPYGVGEGASAWGLGSRMVAGNTHTHTHSKIAKQDRRGMQVSLWQCKNNMGTCKSDGDTIKKTIRMMSIKNDPQTKQQGARRFIPSLHRH